MGAVSPYLNVLIYNLEMIILPSFISRIDDDDEMRWFKSKCFENHVKLIHSQNAKIVQLHGDSIIFKCLVAS